MDSPTGLALDVHMTTRNRDASASTASVSTERIRLAAVFLVGMVGSLISGVKPILVSAYVAALHFTEPQAGTLVGIDMAVLSAGACSCHGDSTVGRAHARRHSPCC